MKFNVLNIVTSHYATLKNVGETKLSRDDVAVFCLLPIMAGVVVYFTGFTFKNDAYSPSISVFAIFAALLLNVQVALFGILQRNWILPSDKMDAAIEQKKLNDRRELLSEVNTNISYLIVFCCLAVSIFLLFHVLNKKFWFEAGLLTSLYVHFVLTIMMVIKRSHALFQKEYEKS